jgi:hypothetical protein
MGLSTKGPITPYKGSWAHEEALRRAGQLEQPKKPEPRKA